jgi:hypothetical protein
MRRKTLVPKYFFMSDNSILMGFGHCTKDSDVAFDGMNE